MKPEWPESLEYPKKKKMGSEDWLSNHALQATPVGASLVVLRRRSGVPELYRYA